mgnify:CR=1 FL=1
MRAAEIRFFWYRAELFSLFSRLPRARCSRGAPFLFFPPPLDVRKRRAGLPKRRGSGTPPMNSNPFQKNTCSENVEFPLSFLFSKSSRQERNRPKGCSSEKDARTKSRHKRKTRKGYLGGGGGCQTSAKERLAFSEKKTREDKTELQFFSFFEFRVLEKRFESLNVFQAFLSSSY